MRVALTLEQCWHNVPGGTAVAALELVRALLPRGDVELVGVAARHRKLPDEPWEPPLPVRSLPLPRLAMYESWHRFRRPSVERATGPVDLVHATGIAMPPATKPVVSTVHDLAYLDYPEMFSRAGLRFFRRALELTLAEATLVLCSSRSTLARCREAGFDEGRLRHVPLGVRVDTASERQVDEMRARFRLERDYILWTGTVEPRKNLHGLLQAFAQIEMQIDLVLVGPSGWNEDLEGAVGSLPEGARRARPPSRVGQPRRPQRALRRRCRLLLPEPSRGLRVPRGRGDGTRNPRRNVDRHLDRGAGRGRRRCCGRPT